MANGKHFKSWIYINNSPEKFLGLLQIGPNSDDFQAIFHQEILCQIQSLFFKFQVQL